MTFTAYLQPSEYATYGITDATAAQVNSATRLIDTSLGRPEGLVWLPDAHGMPAFMANQSPTLSLTGPALAAGNNVTLTIPYAQFGYPNVGDVVILDQATPSITEACVVTAASGNTLTLTNVQFNHPTPTVDFGLTILEEITLRPGAPVLQVHKAPLAQILCGFSRYSFGKFPRQITDARSGYEALLLADTLGLSGPPIWTPMDTTQWDVNFQTGAILVLPYYLPTGQLDIRLRYVAGWSQANLPGAIKQAVANIVRSVIDTPFSANMKLLKAGDSTMVRFGPGVMDADTRALLQPYKLIRV